MADTRGSGAIIPVPVGYMRNRFFPRRIAEYVSALELRQLKAQDITLERDHAFRVVKASDEKKAKSSVIESPHFKPRSVAELLSVRPTTPERSDSQSRT
jgi:ribosomal protein L9